MKKLQYLVIHCTATPEGREVTAAQIRRWHTSPKPAGRGWKQVGYTKMYHLDGSAEQLVANNNDDVVDAWEITNGVAGINSVCQHIVYVGGLDAVTKKPKDTRTAAQRDVMVAEIIAFHQRFPEVKIVGHNHLDPRKACPSFDVQSWLKSIGINQKL